MHPPPHSPAADSRTEDLANCVRHLVDELGRGPVRWPPDPGDPVAWRDRLTPNVPSPPTATGIARLPSGTAPNCSAISPDRASLQLRSLFARVFRWRLITTTASTIEPSCLTNNTAAAIKAIPHQLNSRADPAHR
jgi:hypothetical protein